MIGVLILSDIFRSIKFTALDAIVFAAFSNDEMNYASTLF